MDAVRHWWRVWGGHVYTALAIILTLAALGCVWIVVSSTDPNVMFYGFVVGVLMFLVAVVLGIMGSHKFETKVQRRYVARTDHALEALEPPGRHDRKRERQYPLPQYSPVPDAHSPNEEGSDAR